MPDPQSESAPPGQAIATHSPVTTIIPGQPAPTLSAQAALPIALTPSPTGEPRLLDIAGDDRWIADLAASIVRARSDDGAVQFRLRPEALGAMRVEIEPVGDGASVRLIVETSAAAAMLADGQARLAADARASGMKSFSSAVLLGDTGAQGNSGQTGDHPRQARPRTGDAPQRSDPVQHYDDPTRFA
jgi:flagellar hook-length control protein FliK